MRIREPFLWLLLAIPPAARGRLWQRLVVDTSSRVHAGAVNRVRRCWCLRWGPIVQQRRLWFRPLHVRPVGWRRLG